MEASSSEPPSSVPAGSMSDVRSLMEFMRLVGSLKRLRRTGWVRNGVRDVESDADHMYRMAVMAFLLRPDHAPSINASGGQNDVTETPNDALGDQNKSSGARNSSSEALNEASGAQDEASRTSKWISGAPGETPGASSETSGAQNRVPFDRDRCIRMALVHDMAESLVGDITPFCGVSKAEKRRRETEAMARIREMVGGSVGVELQQLFEEFEEAATPEARAVQDLDKFDMVLQAHEYERLEDRPGALQGFFDSTRDVWRTEQVRGWVQQLEAERARDASEAAAAAGKAGGDSAGREGGSPPAKVEKKA